MTKVASGNIKPTRFVKYDTTVDGKVLQCSTGDRMYGISGPDTRRMPGDLGLDDGYHAVAGADCEVFGEVNQTYLLCLGGTVTRGDRLKSDSDGCGVTTTSTGDWVGAEADMNGTSGQIIPVRILSPAQF